MLFQMEDLIKWGVSKRVRSFITKYRKYFLELINERETLVIDTIQKYLLGDTKDVYDNHDIYTKDYCKGWLALAKKMNARIERMKETKWNSSNESEK